MDIDIYFPFFLLFLFYFIYSTVARKNYKDQGILNKLQKELNEQRKTGKYCDYVLKTQDGGSFTVHKCVLESVSPFFEKMFNFEYDNKRDSVVIPRCSFIVLERIIEFMYTGTIEITCDIAKETLDQAYFLGLNTLVDTCTEVLIKTVNCENCFELVAYSETYSYAYSSGEALTKKCVEVIAKKIKIFKNSPEFDKLSLDSMKYLSSCDRRLCNEEELYLAIVKWIKFDIENREQDIPVLFDQIKFEEISLEFGVKEVLKDKHLWKNQKYISKIREIISENWSQQLKEKASQTGLYPSDGSCPKLLVGARK